MNVKRAILTHSTNDDAHNINNHIVNTSSTEFEATSETMLRFFDVKQKDVMHSLIDDCNQNCLTKDEFIIFGNYVANELRKIKTDEFRRRVKQAVRQCLLYLTAEENALFIEQNQLNDGF